MITGGINRSGRGDFYLFIEGCFRIDWLMQILTAVVVTWAGALYDLECFELGLDQ
jgi:hypothetical protein